MPWNLCGDGAEKGNYYCSVIENMGRGTTLVAMMLVSKEEN